MTNPHGIPAITDMRVGSAVRFAPRNGKEQVYCVHGNCAYYRSSYDDHRLHRAIWLKVNDYDVPLGFQINHIDGVKLNNDPLKLEIVTQKGANYKDELRRRREVNGIADEL